MKAFACLIIFIELICTSMYGQSALPSAGPSFSAKDTTKADVLSVASLQVFPVGIDKLGNEAAADSSVVLMSSAPKKATPDPDPIRDWSNPPGYMGASGSPTAMVKHKPLTGRKYHRKRLRRCYTF